MGNMLERMHGVSERELHAPKRRKYENEEEKEQNKVQFNGGSMGGVLGNYMKEQREAGRKEALKNGTKVSAISIPDDDVTIVYMADKEVCLGRLEGAEINTHKVPTPKPGTTSISAANWPQVRLQLRRREGDNRTNVIHVYDGVRELVGCVDVNTSIALTPLLDADFKLRTAARILSRPKKENDPKPGDPVSCRYPLDLTLYGPKKYAAQIGRHLSQKNVWLRTPMFVEAGLELHNPHAIDKLPPSMLKPSSASYGSSRTSGPVRTTEEIRNDVFNVFDTLERSENLPEMGADPRILTDLLKHQKQGLYFMTGKEHPRVFGSGSDDKGNSSLWRLSIGASGQKSYYNVITGQTEKENPPQVLGGILADMMGLGKTLSILSLIVSTLDTDAQQWEQQDPATEDEDRRAHHERPSKGKGKALPKVECAKLRRNCKTTLLVSPLSTIANWEEQIKQHIKPGALKYYIYHGANRIKDINKLAEFDIVITTYGSIASEYNNRSKGKRGTFPLEEINWFRIVLDEAHMIREQATQQSKAICRLAANRRWAVTGTPVQNRLDDLGALLVFLRVKPFDERNGFNQYIMAPFKMCDPEILPKLRLLVDSLTLRRLKDKIDLPARRDHLVKLDFNPEEQILYDIFAKNASDRVKVIAGQQSLGGKSYVHILQSILRLRLICAHGRDLLGEEDLKVMDGLSKDSAIDLDSDDEGSDKAALSKKSAYDTLQLMQETNADLCVSCNRKIGTQSDLEDEPKDDVMGYMTQCFHVICPTCKPALEASFTALLTQQSGSTINCPFCNYHIRVTLFPLRQEDLDEEQESKAETKAKSHGKVIKPERYSGPHTKTKALISDLLSSRQESQLKPAEPPIKSVIFSGWTSHLDLIEIALHENAIPYTRLDGKMTRIARANAITSFREDPSIVVILVSIAAGGLGLNLTTGNKVYVMEPQYNPAAEAQAIDRVHRLGQKREVETVRYIMRDSFEEKMLELQEKKKRLASLSMDSDGMGMRGRIDKGEAAKKRLEELRSLFK